MGVAPYAIAQLVDGIHWERFSLEEFVFISKLHHFKVQFIIAFKADQPLVQVSLGDRAHRNTAVNTRAHTKL